MWTLETIVPKMEPRIRTRESLPDPPSGMAWEQNEQTKAWSLVPCEKQQQSSLLGGDKPTGQQQGNKKTSVSSDCEQQSRPPLPTTRSSVKSACSSVKSCCSNHTVTAKIVDLLLPSEEKQDDDWTLCSDRISIESAVLVAHATTNGSITSLTTTEQPNILTRTLSSSTIDSIDGDKTLGLLGVDYIEHVVLPSDTLQGICLAYKISATRLRQANQFSGNSLSLAPKKLIVPLSKQALRTGFIKTQDKESKEYKIHALLAAMPHLNELRAQEYLDQSDWIVQEALESAKEDVEWEKPEEERGEVLVTIQVKEGVPIDVKASGNRSPHRPHHHKKKKNLLCRTPLKKVTAAQLPAIATKNVRPQDVYNAASQHNEFGFELKDLN